VENAMKKALVIGALCGFFALVFTACEYNAPMADYIDYYLHFTPVTTWGEIQDAIDNTPAGRVNIGLMEGIYAPTSTITIPANKTVSIVAHSGDRTITRTTTSVSLFVVNGGTLILGDSGSDPLELNGGGGYSDGTVPLGQRIV
jgi:hypothetical protein